MRIECFESSYESIYNWLTTNISPEFRSGRYMDIIGKGWRIEMIFAHPEDPEFDHIRTREGYAVHITDEKLATLFALTFK